MTAKEKAARERGSLETEGSQRIAPVPLRRDTEAEARAGIAAIALQEARKLEDPAQKRACLERVRVQLLKSLCRVEIDLARIPA